MSKHINPSAAELDQDLRDNVEEGLSEIQDLAVGGQMAMLPLVACATMLGSATSVWQRMSTAFLMDVPQLTYSQ